MSSSACDQSCAMFPGMKLSREFSIASQRFPQFSRSEAWSTRVGL